MTQIPTFGFSAFLRLISLNERPQRTAVRERYRQDKNGSGYDYHRSLRQSVQKLATASMSPDEVFAATANIKNKAEKRSARRGIVRFLKWRKAHGNPISFCDPIVFESPDGLFRVRFDADCVIEIEGRRTAIHIWNTKQPKLLKSAATAALAIVQRHWPKDIDTVDDFAVLSLQDMEFHRWSENPKTSLAVGDAIIRHLDRQCSLLRREVGLPSKPEPEAPRAD